MNIQISDAQIRAERKEFEKRGFRKGLMVGIIAMMLPLLFVWSMLQSLIKVSL